MLKHYFIIAVFAICCLKSTAQDTTFIQTKFEIFNDRPNVLFKTDTRSTDFSNGYFKADRIRSTEVYTGQSMTVIKLSGTRSIYIDFDDIDSIVSVLKVFEMEALKPKPKNVILYNYITANGIYISYVGPTGLFYTPSVTIGRISRYAHFLIPSSIILTKKRISDFIDMLTQEKMASF